MYAHGIKYSYIIIPAMDMTWAFFICRWDCENVEVQWRWNIGVEEGKTNFIIAIEEGLQS